jgi:hypothetical protein
VPAGGLLILRDGEPEVTLSPLACHYQHRAEIEAVVQGADRDAAFDTLNASIGTALAADWTRKPRERLQLARAALRGAERPGITPSRRAVIPAKLSTKKRR